MEITHEHLGAVVEVWGDNYRFSADANFIAAEALQIEMLDKLIFDYEKPPTRMVRDQFIITAIEFSSGQITKVIGRSRQLREDRDLTNMIEDMYLVDEKSPVTDVE